MTSRGQEPAGKLPKRLPKLEQAPAQSEAVEYHSVLHRRADDEVKRLLPDRAGQGSQGVAEEGPQVDPDLGRRRSLD